MKFDIVFEDGNPPEYREDMLEAAIRSALLLMDGARVPPGSDPWDTVLGQLPAGGVRCEKLAEQAVSILREALS